MENSKETKETPEEFYAKLKTQLDEQHNFPTDYMYKFIVPKSVHNLALVEEVFNGAEEKSLNSRDSKTGKYTSVTIKIKAKSSDEVIGYYQEAAKIPGIVSL